MVTVLDMLQQFLCYGNTQCVQEFSSYAYQPIEGIFYLVFFPIVFILMFIYIISATLGTFRENKKFRILIAVGVFAFIILQGWYHLFLILGQLWFFVIIVLGFFWFLLHTFIDRGGGGGKSRAAGGGAGGAGIGGALTKRLKNQMSGKVRTAEQALIRALKAAEGIIKRVDSGDDQAYRAISTTIISVEEALRAYREIVAVEGFTVGGKYRELEKRADRIVEKLNKISARKGKAQES